MKKLILSLVILMSVSAVNAQKISGKWNGSMNIHGKQLGVAFNISRTSKGGFTSTMDSPEQKVYGLETSYTTLKDYVLTIQLENAKLEYVGTMNKDGKFVGVLKQFGELFPLELKKD
jgi:uncharacterized protein